MFSKLRMGHIILQAASFTYWNLMPAQSITNTQPEYAFFPIGLTLLQTQWTFNHIKPEIFIMTRSANHKGH